MVRFVRRAADRCNRKFGLGLTQVYLYRLTSSSNWAASNASPIELRWEVLADERVKSLSEVGLFELHEALERLQHGCVCYVAHFQDRLAHYSWVQRSGMHLIEEAGRSVPIESGDFWIFHCVTAEWARGKGIYPATLRRIVREHFDAGYRTAWIYANRKNAASQKAITTAGFSFCGTRNAFRVGEHYYRLHSPSSFFPLSGDTHTESS